MIAQIERVHDSFSLIGQFSREVAEIFLPREHSMTNNQRKLVWVSSGGWLMLDKNQVNWLRQIGHFDKVRFGNS